MCLRFLVFFVSIVKQCSKSPYVFPLLLLCIMLSAAIFSSEASPFFDHDIWHCDHAVHFYEISFSDNFSFDCLFWFRILRNRMDLITSKAWNNLLFKRFVVHFTIQLFTHISSYELATFHPRLRLQAKTFGLLLI